MDVVAKWKSKRLSLSVFAALIIFASTLTQVYAQAGGGTLSGRVTSPDGSGVLNARISIKNMENGDVRTLTINPDGSFVLQNLLPGVYEITVSAPGFTTTKRKSAITLGVDQTLNVLIQSENAAVRGVVNSKSLSDLPLNGRSASDLATLEPGVATARTQTSGQGQRGFGTQMVISGGRPRQNDSRLDGISVNDYVNGPPGSALGFNLGSDAVEQFTMLSSNYPAQFGRSSGGSLALPLIRVPIASMGMPLNTSAIARLMLEISLTRQDPRSTVISSADQSVDQS